jgi:hypothetical protein
MDISEIREDAMSGTNPRASGDTCTITCVGACLQLKFRKIFFLPRIGCFQQPGLESAEEQDDTLFPIIRQCDRRWTISGDNGMKKSFARRFLRGKIGCLGESTFKESDMTTH